MKYNQDYTDYQLDRSFLRKLVRKYYLRTLSQKAIGRTIDFGCGIGEIIPYLPEGSLGLEVNKATVAYCKNKGLNVEFYNYKKDQYMFRDFSSNYYSTFLMSHVLEHIENAHEVFKKILSSCNKIGIKKIILVVPSQKGFAYDKTHKTFIDLEYLKSHNLYTYEDYKITEKKYFPFNAKWVGNYFTHNELRVIYDRI